MLEFEEIKIDDKLTFESIGDSETHIPKVYILVFSDDELLQEDIPELKKRLEKHDFSVNDELIQFSIYNDKYERKHQIIMDISYFYPKSKGDSNIPDIDAVEKLYHPAFEDFYKKNKPY